MQSGLAAKLLALLCLFTPNQAAMRFQSIKSRVGSAVSEFTTDYIDDFSDYIHEFGKANEYSDLSDAILLSKYKSFVSTHLYITKINNLPDTTYKLSHNHFSDWSLAQKKSLFMPKHEMASVQNDIIIKQECPLYMYEGIMAQSRDFREIDTRVLDQGDCGACWDFAVLNNLELNRMICNGVKQDLSAQYVLDCIPFGNCSGGSALYTFEWIHDTSQGVCPESDYLPYSASKNKECGQCASHPLVGDFQSIVCFANETSHQMALVAGYLSVQFSMPVFGTDLMLYESGVFDCTRVAQTIDNILSTDNTTEYLHKYQQVEFLGYHALTTVGVTKDYFIVKNSWGTSWGQEGYFYLKRANFGDCKPLLFIASDFYGLMPSPPPSLASDSQLSNDAIAFEKTSSNLNKIDDIQHSLQTLQFVQSDAKMVENVQNAQNVENDIFIDKNDKNGGNPSLSHQYVNISQMASVGSVSASNSHGMDGNSDGNFLGWLLGHNNDSNSQYFVIMTLLLSLIGFILVVIAFILAVRYRKRRKYEKILKKYHRDQQQLKQLQQSTHTQHTRPHELKRSKSMKQTFGLKDKSRIIMIRSLESENKQESAPINETHAAARSVTNYGTLNSVNSLDRMGSCCREGLTRSYCHNSHAGHATHSACAAPVEMSKQEKETKNKKESIKSWIKRTELHAKRPGYGWHGLQPIGAGVAIESTQSARTLLRAGHRDVGDAENVEDLGFDKSMRSMPGLRSCAGSTGLKNFGMGCRSGRINGIGSSCDSLFSASSGSNGLDWGANGSMKSLDSLNSLNSLKSMQAMQAMQAMQGMKPMSKVDTLLRQVSLMEVERKMKTTSAEAKSCTRKKCGGKDSASRSGLF